jgi:hypothetical protein
MAIALPVAVTAAGRLSRDEFIVIVGELDEPTASDSRPLPEALHLSHSPSRRRASRGDLAAMSWL